MHDTLAINESHQKAAGCPCAWVSDCFVHYPLQAALVNLAQRRWRTPRTTTVLPNVMFTLDDSGSMGWDFMPDWVGDNYPRASDANLYRNSAWNVTYYNPAINYSPPVHFNSDGTPNTTTYPSKNSGWNSVKYDAYGKYSNDVVYLSKSALP